MSVETLVIGVLALGMGIALSFIASRRPVSAVERRESHLEVVIADLTAKLEAANQKIGRLEARITELETALRRYETEHGQSNVLLIAIGTDPMLKVDLSALRAAISRGGMVISRVLPVTRANFKRMIDAPRAQGRPIRYLHIATHAGPDGVEFADGLADGVWLSGQLNGFQIVVIGGCRAAGVGDLLGLVPLVVSMREDLAHDDAFRFAQVFWSAVADGLMLSDIEDRCRERLPGDLMEYVEFRY